MAELRKREGVAARALEFLILTAARTGEVIGAQRPEIDFKARVKMLDEQDNSIIVEMPLWTIPDGRMKASREHRVPLAPAAVALLKSLYSKAGSDFIFIGPRNARLSDAAMSAVLQRMGTGATVHGFRSSFRDWAAETTAFPGDVIEMALAHTIANKTEAAYRRGDLLDKRRKLMEAWAVFCNRKPAAAGAKAPKRAATNNVVSLRRPL
ncbi:MAG TPA: site-specific integrase [Xanthobacteraceae bacterium]